MPDGFRKPTEDELQFDISLEDYDFPGLKKAAPPPRKSRQHRFVGWCHGEERAVEEGPLLGLCPDCMRRLRRLQRLAAEIRRSNPQMQGVGIAEMFERLWKYAKEVTRAR